MSPGHSVRQHGGHHSLEANHEPPPPQGYVQSWAVSVLCSFEEIFLCAVCQSGLEEVLDAELKTIMEAVKGNPMIAEALSKL